MNMKPRNSTLHASASRWQSSRGGPSARRCPPTTPNRGCTTPAWSRAATLTPAATSTTWSMATKAEAYVDTSALIAFADRSDSYHPTFRRLFAKPPSLLTTTLVVAEGHGWFLRRYDRNRALQFLAMIEAMTPLIVVAVGPEEQAAARGLLLGPDSDDDQRRHGLDHGEELQRPVAVVAPQEPAVALCDHERCGEQRRRLGKQAAKPGVVRIRAVGEGDQRRGVDVGLSLCGHRPRRRCGGWRQGRRSRPCRRSASTVGSRRRAAPCGGPASRTRPARCRGAQRAVSRLHIHLGEGSLVYVS